MINKAKFLFIGSFSTSNLLSKTLLSKNLAADFATNNYQHGFLKTINNPNRELTIVSLPFARRRKINFLELFIGNFSQKTLKGTKTYFLPNMTIPILRNIWEFILLFLFLWFTKSSSFNHIIIFSPSVSLNLAVILYSKIKGIRKHIICVVDDLPEYTNTSNKKIIKKIKNIYIEKIKKWDNFYFGFILLSQGMKDKYITSKSKYLVMEGIYNDDQYIVTNSSVDTYKILGFNLQNLNFIMYAGNLEDKHGVVNLIEGFVKYKRYYKSRNLYLLIVGFSKKEHILKSSYNENKKIIFLDSMEKSTLAVLMKEALCLFIPTPPEEEFTKYFFPSKVIEYMSSGTITALTKLSCVPKEYFAHSVNIQNSDKNGIYQTIKLVNDMTKSQRSIIGEKAKKFILKEKSWKSWSKKFEKWLHLK